VLPINGAMRFWSRIVWCAVLITVGAAPAAHAAATLDPAFGDQGLATTNFGGTDYGNGVAVQDDGRIVSAGYRTSNGPTWYDFIGQRLEPAGDALDTSFGLGGGFLTPMSAGQANDHAEDVALAPGGRIVVAGYTIPEGGHTGSLAVARYDSAGSLDPSFGSGGKAIVSVAGEGQFEQYNAVAVQADGKVLVTGGVRLDPDDSIHLTVVRLTAGGSLDTSFGDQGVARIVAGTQSSGTHIELTPGGGILAAGYCYSGGVQVPLVVRLTGSGAPDPGFDGDGVLALPASLGGVPVGIAGGVDATTGGNILVGLWHNSIGSHHWGVARLTPGGALDGSFGGGDGVVTSTLTDVNGGVIMEGLEIDSHGRVVVGGSAASNQPAVARYTPAGEPDTGFGPAGVVVVEDALLHAGGFTVDAQDRPLLSGVDIMDMVIARFTAGDPPAPPPDGGSGGSGGASSGGSDAGSGAGPDAPIEPPAGPADTTRALVRIVVKRDIVLVPKMAFAVRVNEAADVTATLEVSARAALRAGISAARKRRAVVIARGRVSLTAAGRAKVRIKVGARARRALSRGRRPVAATLRLRVKDRAGNVTVLTRAVRLRTR